MKELTESIPPIDILIDDGGHTMEQQITTFEELYGYIKPDGVYLCEDTHTSYFQEYDGGYKKPDTFIEYSKNLIDFLNAFHSRSAELQVSAFTKTADSLHYYDSIVVVEKRNKEKPYAQKTGKKSY